MRVIESAGQPNHARLWAISLHSWSGRIRLAEKARSVKEEAEARIQKASSSPTDPSEPARLGRPTLTQLGDASYAGGQEGLLQGPELQLSVCIGSLIMAQGPAIVRTEVRREREDTCVEIGR